MCATELYCITELSEVCVARLVARRPRRHDRGCGWDARPAGCPRRRRAGAALAHDRPVPGDGRPICGSPSIHSVSLTPSALATRVVPCRRRVGRHRAYCASEAMPLWRCIGDQAGARGRPWAPSISGNLRPTLGDVATRRSASRRSGRASPATSGPSTSTEPQFDDSQLHRRGCAGSAAWRVARLDFRAAHPRHAERSSGTAATPPRLRRSQAARRRRYHRRSIRRQLS